MILINILITKKNRLNANKNIFIANKNILITNKNILITKKEYIDYKYEHINYKYEYIYYKYKYIDYIYENIEKYIDYKSDQGLHTTLKYIHRILEDSIYNLAFANLVAKMGPKPKKKSLDNSLNTSLEEMDSETTVKEQASHQGFLYKDLGK